MLFPFWAFVGNLSFKIFPLNRDADLESRRAVANLWESSKKQIGGVERKWAANDLRRFSIYYFFSFFVSFLFITVIFSTVVSFRGTSQFLSKTRPQTEAKLSSQFTRRHKVDLLFVFRQVSWMIAPPRKMNPPFLLCLTMKVSSTRRRVWLQGHPIDLLWFSQESPCFYFSAANHWNCFHDSKTKQHNLLSFLSWFQAWTCYSNDFQNQEPSRKYPPAFSNSLRITRYSNYFISFDFVLLEYREPGRKSSAAFSHLF